MRACSPRGQIRPFPDDIPVPSENCKGSLPLYLSPTQPRGTPTAAILPTGCDFPILPIDAASILG